MAVYKNLTRGSAVQAVEFTPVSDGNLTFIHTDRATRDDVKQWLTSQEVGQEIIAETHVNGKQIIISHGDKTKEEMSKLLEARGDKLQLDVPKKGPNFWAIRGGMSVVGQTLQLASALTQVEKVSAGHPSIDPKNAHFNQKLADKVAAGEEAWVRKGFSPDIGAFAILNLIANGANIMYGGQKESGENRLHHVKRMINEDLDEHLPPGVAPIPVEDHRADLRKGPQPPKTAMQKFNEFAEENSVRFFEIGLRYLAAVALVFPINKKKLGEGLSKLRQGQVVEAWNAAKNPNNLTKFSGLGYLTGKALALGAKVPDPYEDKPHTWVDTVREDWLFKVGGAIESVAGAGIAYNAFNSKKVGLSDPKKPDITPHRDWAGTVGGGLFALGYIVRMGADFGSKQVNMDEVYAHASDTLAQTPPDKLPQLMADTAANLTEHFKDKNMEFGKTFTQMMTDMYRYHHIALDNLGTEPQERLAKLNGHGEEASRQVEHAAHAKPSPHLDLAAAPRSLKDRAPAPAASHADLASAQSSPQHSI